MSAADVAAKYGVLQDQVIADVGKRGISQAWIPSERIR